MDLKTAYGNQKRRALNRNIDWQFTFDTWMNWWLSTGQIENRGRNKGQFVMCRLNDSGPYSPQNVYCGSHSDNIADAHKSGAQSKSDRCTFAGLHHTDESKRLISLNSANKLSEDEINRRIEIYNKMDKSWGYLSKYAKEIGISHTHARRFINEYCV